MPREKLTPERIRRFTCLPDLKQSFLWDTEAPRLAVRATAGAKAFVFESKLNRQTIRRTIGDVRDWSLPEARAEARRLQTQIDQGIDPREQDRDREAAREAAKAARETAKREAEERARYTLSALCDTYTDKLVGEGKRRSAADASSAFRVHVVSAHPEIASLPAREITPHHIAELVRKVREAGKERAAGVLRSYLSAAFNSAKRAPLDAKEPAAMIPFRIEQNPVIDIPAIAVRRGNRTLSADELRAYMSGLSDGLADQALRLALFAGGQRMAQLLRAKVSDYDPDSATLRLWDPKGKRSAPREHLLPLAPAAAALVARLVERARDLEASRNAGRTDLWLFSATGRVPMDQGTPGERAAEICKGMGGEPFNLRDVRRTAETMLSALRISKDTRAQLLSHGISGVQSAVYDRHDYADEKRAALVAWEARLDAIAKGEKAPANVVELRSA